MFIGMFNTNMIIYVYIYAYYLVIKFLVFTYW